MRNWIAARLEAGEVVLRELAGVLGRMSFAAGPLELVRPFLAPLFAWVAARGYEGSARLPWSALFLLTLLAEAFSDERRICEVRRRAHNQ